MWRLLLVALWALPATAQELNTDQFRPSFAERNYLSRAELSSTPGLRLGIALSGERAPLVVADGGRALEVIDVRGALTLGAFAATSFGLSAEASVSLFASAAGGGAWSLGGELPVAAIGELRVRSTFAPLHFRLTRDFHLRAGVWAGLNIPTATPNALVGEDNVRAEPGLIVEAAWRWFHALLSVSAVIRSLLDTRHALTLRGEAGLCLALAADIPSSALRGVLELRARPGLWGSKGIGLGPAEVDLGLSTSLGPFRGFALIGTALSSGYGTPDLRVSLGISLDLRAFSPPSDPSAPQLGREEAEGGELKRQRALVDIDAILAEPGEARPNRSQATPELECPRYGAPVFFSMGSANLDSTATTTLSLTARALNEDPAILHLLVEGHASTEGSAQYNWDLSMARATAVLKQLIAAGLDPTRVSLRGFGKVAAAERRVDLCVLRTRRGDEILTTPLERVPWESP